MDQLNYVKILSHYKSISDICSHILNNVVLAVDVNHDIFELAPELGLGSLHLPEVRINYIVRLFIIIPAITVVV